MAYKGFPVCEINKCHRNTSGTEVCQSFEGYSGFCNLNVLIAVLTKRHLPIFIVLLGSQRRPTWWATPRQETQLGIRPHHVVLLIAYNWNISNYNPNHMIFSRVLIQFFPQYCKIIEYCMTVYFLSRIQNFSRISSEQSGLIHEYANVNKLVYL